MRALVRFIDRLLSDAQGIVEFSQDPRCVLRVQLGKATYSPSFGSVRISKGDPVLILHAWNKRMPKLPTGGPTLEWAIQLRRQVIYSFGLITQLMEQDARYSQVLAVCGASALFSFSEHTGGTRLMQHLGFTVLPYHRPLGRFGEFWENLFSWWLLWAYNETSIHSRHFTRLIRTEIWMTTAEFLHRYKPILSPGVCS